MMAKNSFFNLVAVVIVVLILGACSFMPNDKQSITITFPLARSGELTPYTYAISIFDDTTTGNAIFDFYRSLPSNSNMVFNLDTVSFENINFPSRVNSVFLPKDSSYFVNVNVDEYSNSVTLRLDAVMPGRKRMIIHGLRRVSSSYQVLYEYGSPATQTAYISHTPIYDFNQQLPNVYMSAEDSFTILNGTFYLNIQTFYSDFFEVSANNSTLVTIDGENSDYFSLRFEKNGGYSS